MLALLRPLAVAAALALGRAGAAETQGEPAAPPAKAPEQANGEPPDSRKEDGNWVDAGHDFIEQRVFAPVLRLDRFFSDEREFEAERSRSFLRWRSEVRLDQDRARPVFTTGVRATLRLPGLNKRLRRLRVVIAGETRDAIDTLFPRRPGSGRTAENEDDDDESLGTGDAGLRFHLWDTLASHADLGGGILADLPPGVYGRIRFRWAVPVRKLFLVRTVLTPFWRSDDPGFGTSGGVELERPLNEMLVTRLGGTGNLSEASRGVEWGAELALLATLDARSGAQIGAGVTGATDPLLVQHPLTLATRRAPGIDSYRIYTRLRRDVYRRWLFLEIEPEIAWPWTVEQGRHAAWGLAFRVEVQFHGNEAPPEPQPPPPPEPKDPPPDPVPHAPGPG